MSGVFTWKMPRTLFPVLAQTLEGHVGGLAVEVPGDHRLDKALVDGLRAGRIELPVPGVLVITKHEDDLLRLAGLEVEPDLMRADGRPAMGDGVGQLTGFDGCGLVPAAVGTKKRLALCVKASGPGREQAKRRSDRGARGTPSCDK
jgi:hypothetical protein